MPGTTTREPLLGAGPAGVGRRAVGRAALLALALAAAAGGCREAPGEAPGPPTAAAPGDADRPQAAAAAAPEEGAEVRSGPRRPAEAEGRQEAEATPAERSAYDTAMIEGAAALASGRFDEARRQYLRAMELEPDKTEAVLGALRTMMLRGHGEARAGLEKRVRRKIESYRASPETAGAAHLLSARLAIALEEPGEAMDTARLAVERLPELGVAWRVLGEAAVVAERWGQAVEAFRRAAELGLAAKSGTWERLADALDELGELAAAEEAARRALELTGSDPHARRRRLNLLGVVQKHRGDLDGAAATFAQALALGPKDPAVLHNLGALAEARGDLDAALARYDEALAEAPVPTTAWRRGHVLLKLDRRQEALDAFTTAAAHLDRWQWPRSTRWWPAYDVGRIYARASHDKEAVGWFEDAMRQARTPRAIREVRSWLTWTRVQSGMKRPDGEPLPDAPLPAPGE